MEIITKFTIATNAGTAMLLELTRALAIEKFSSLLNPNILNEYIDSNFNRKKLIAEINDFGNQWLTVYVDDNPAGYAKITYKGKRPHSLENKTAARISDFGILSKYSEKAIINSLLDKCITVNKNREGIWVNEYLENPFIPFFEARGFEKQPETSHHEELALPAVYLVYMSDASK